MSLNSFLVSLIFSDSCTCTTAIPGRDIDFIANSFPPLGSWRESFWAIVSSMGLVTSCSTFSAVAPGHGHTARAIRTGISGSFLLGMFIQPYIPHAITAASSTHDIWRFSVKKRAVLWVPAIISLSSLWAMDGLHSLNVAAGCRLRLRGLESGSAPPFVQIGITVLC